MSRNYGKVFEEEWRQSVPDYALLYRLPDPAQSFGGGSSLRFSRKPDFDYLLWDSNCHILYALELKTVGGKSISFERTDKDKGEIHRNQIEGLNRWDRYDGIVCGFIIHFRKIETTVFISVKQMNEIICIIPKKSFNFEDLDQYGITYIIIPQTKLRTRYRYNADFFLQEIKKKLEEDRDGEKL